MSHNQNILFLIQNLFNSFGQGIDLAFENGFHKKIESTIVKAFNASAKLYQSCYVHNNESNMDYNCIMQTWEKNKDMIHKGIDHLNIIGIDVRLVNSLYNEVAHSFNLLK